MGGLMPKVYSIYWEDWGADVGNATHLFPTLGEARRAADAILDQDEGLDEVEIKVVTTPPLTVKFFCEIVSNGGNHYASTTERHSVVLRWRGLHETD